MNRETEQEINQRPPEPNAVESLLFETAAPVEGAIRRSPESPETLAQTSDSTSIGKNQSRVERCEHGMISTWCTDCRSKRKPNSKPKLEASDFDDLALVKPDSVEPEASLAVLKKGISLFLKEKEL